MTTPSYVMPYGVTVEGDGTNNPKLVGAHQRQVSNSGLALTPGPCQVRATWEGPQALSVLVQKQGTKDWREVAVIPEKAGGARSAMVTVGAVEGEYVYLNGSRLTTGARGTIEVYPMPTD